MSDLVLKTFNKLYPMMIRKYSDLIIDQNASEKDKINSIILKLNALGKLSNDVVRDWNTVYQWAMNDGLTQDVNNKLEDMLAKGQLKSITDALVAEIGDLTTLTTPQKDTVVHSINSLQSEVTTNITQLSDIAINLSKYHNLNEIDWGLALQRANDYLNGLGGGRILLPTGNINIQTPTILSSGITVQGNSRNYHGGSRITIQGTNNHAFFIGENTHDVIFSNFVIDGVNKSNGHVGILSQGAYPNSSYRITFDELDIYGMDKCIAIIATDTNKNWQCDNILFNHCQFVESNYGIYGDAMNFDYVKILNCSFGCLHSIYLLHGGRFNIDTCSAGYSPDTVNSEFIHIERVGTVLVQSSQAESMGYFLVYTDGISSNLNPLTLIANIINCPVNFRTTRPVVSIGNYYTTNFSFMDNAGDCIVTSFNDSFSNGNKFIPYLNTTIQALGSGVTKHTSDYISDYNPNGFPVNVTNQLLMDTNNDIIINVRTKPNGNYILYVYYTVITATTNVSVNAEWNDIQTGHQSKVLDSGSKDVGSYTLTPLFINNTGDAGTQTISLKIQAGTANQVYVSTSLVKL